MYPRVGHGVVDRFGLPVRVSVSSYRTIEPLDYRYRTMARVGIVCKESDILIGLMHC